MLTSTAIFIAITLLLPILRTRYSMQFQLEKPQESDDLVLFITRPLKRVLFYKN